MSTILIGVDGSAGADAAVAFGGRLAAASGARVVVACAFLCGGITFLEAKEIARRACDRLDGVAGDWIEDVVVAGSSPAHALHDLAVERDASIVVVGSSASRRVAPGATAERLLHGGPCPVAVVPLGHRPGPVRRVGAAYDGSPEASAALAAATLAARTFDAELELIGVVPAAFYAVPAMTGGSSSTLPRREIEGDLREQLDATAAAVPADVRATDILLDGEAAEQIAGRTAGLDLLLIGSRGYGPMHAVFAGGVSGRVVRQAHCPVIVVPRGVAAPLADLFGG